MCHAVWCRVQALDRALGRFTHGFAHIAPPALALVVVRAHDLALGCSARDGALGRRERTTAHGALWWRAFRRTHLWARLLVVAFPTARRAIVAG